MSDYFLDNINNLDLFWQRVSLQVKCRRVREAARMGTCVFAEGVVGSQSCPPAPLSQVGSPEAPPGMELDNVFSELNWTLPNRRW